MIGINEQSEVGYRRREKYCAYSIIAGRALNLNGNHNPITDRPKFAKSRLVR